MKNAARRAQVKRTGARNVAPFSKRLRKSGKKGHKRSTKRSRKG